MQKTRRRTDTANTTDNIINTVPEVYCIPGSQVKGESREKKQRRWKLSNMPLASLGCETLWVEAARTPSNAIFCSNLRPTNSILDTENCSCMRLHPTTFVFHPVGTKLYVATLVVFSWSIHFLKMLFFPPILRKTILILSNTEVLLMYWKQGSVQRPNLLF